MRRVPKTREILISADSRVGEPMELWDRLPALMQVFRPRYESLADGEEKLEIEGSLFL